MAVAMRLRAAVNEERETASAVAGQRAAHVALPAEPKLLTAVED
jgi:hypothetical protein